MIPSMLPSISIERNEVARMKKVPSKEALSQEAAFWDKPKKASKDNPGKACHK